ncbi:MAG: hypothetical protein J7L55_05115 [Desulfurococcales archaeon]|nr:hypothetical protein [Desulfurococcales archaeon]
MRIKCCATYVVREVLGEEPNDFSGRLAAQKLIYLIQKVLGINLGYSFMWFSRGPYSKALAKDLRGCEEGVKCLGDDELRKARELISRLRGSGVPLTKALEIAASYLMLRDEVFPKPEDPVKELLERKPFIKDEEVNAVLDVLSPFL